MLLIMRNNGRLLPIEGIVLLTFMLTLVADMNACSQVVELPQCAISTTDCTAGPILGDAGEPYTNSVSLRRTPVATSIAKNSKAKSTLPYRQWTPSTATPTTPLYLRAGFVLHALAPASCYAIHPRPPTFVIL